MEEVKSLKQYCREAKQRLKSNFWQEYKAKLAQQQNELPENNQTKVQEYYQTKVIKTIKGVDPEEEKFYLKVKEILSKFGEVSDIIGRLTDKEYFKTLTYEQKQRYTFDLSEKYIKAKERYYKELQFESNNNLKE